MLASRGADEPRDVFARVPTGCEEERVDDDSRRPGLGARINGLSEIRLSDFEMGRSNLHAGSSRAHEVGEFFELLVRLAAAAAVVDKDDRFAVHAFVIPNTSP